MKQQNDNKIFILICLAHKIFNCVIVGITSPLSSSNTPSLPLSLSLSLLPPSLYHSPSVISFRLCNMRNVFGYGDSQRTGSPTELSQFPCNLGADVYSVYIFERRWRAEPESGEEAEAEAEQEMPAKILQVCNLHLAAFFACCPLTSACPCLPFCYLFSWL